MEDQGLGVNSQVKGSHASAASEVGGTVSVASPGESIATDEADSASNREPGRGTAEPSPASNEPFDPAQTDFDTVADEYDDSLPHHVMDYYLDKRATFIRQHVAPGRVVDIGCGTGVLAARLNDEGYEVTGVDPFRGMLKFLKNRRPGLNAVHAFGQRLPFEDNSFDLAYCVAVMHHVADPQAVRETVLEMTRVTKPGGHILIWDHNPRNPYWPILMRRVPQDTGAERLIPERELLEGLRAGGAKPIFVQPLSLIPDFTPKRFLKLAIKTEGIVERIPLFNRLCAHNVILAVKAA